MKYRKWLGIAGTVCIALLGAASAWADDAAECKKLYTAEQYNKAFPICRKAAEQGYASAQFNLGVMYDNGRGVKQDSAETAKWYRKAAEQGYAKAQFNLGLMYTNGQGVKQDYAEATSWFRKAAEQGHAKAQFILGEMYAAGLGVIQSDAAAADWYYKAGLSFLKKGDRNMALTSAEEIKKLGDIPNAFLGDQLIEMIYGKKTK